MDRVRFISHKGKKIFLIDFSNCTPEKILKNIGRATEIIARQPEHSLLTLTNARNAHYNSELIEVLKKFTAHNKPYVKKGAVFGISGLQKLVYNAVMKFSKRNLLLFNDLEKAKDWLVEGEEEPVEFPTSLKTEQKEEPEERKEDYASKAERDASPISKQNCWEYMKCSREPGGAKADELGVCPTTIDASSDGINQGTNAGRICWAVAGTLCGGKVQGTFAKKQLTCFSCDFFQKVSKEEGEKFELLKPSQIPTPPKLTKK